MAGEIAPLTWKQELSTEEAFERFLRISVADGAASRRTIQTYRAGLTVFLAWAKSIHVDPKTATYDDIECYRSYLGASGLKRSTVKLRLVSVRALYTALQRWGMRPDNPAAGVKAPRDKESTSSGIIRKALKPDEIRRLLEALPATWAPQDVRDATIVRLMLFCGLRAGEICALNADSLDYDSFSTLRVLGKGSKLRTIVLPAEVRKDLIAWTNAAHPAGSPANPMFFGFDRPGMNRLGVRSVERITDKYLTKAGLKQPGRSAHSCRHGFALMAVLGGATREALADAMGHASTSVADSYLRGAAQFMANPCDAAQKALAEWGNK